MGREPLDLEAMRRAAAPFVGRKDFQAFTDDDPDEKSTVVVVDELEIAEAGALVLIRITGSHFLWKMVRRIVGVLTAVGRGEIGADRAAHTLTGGDVAKLTAPAAGLFLERVFYDRNEKAGPMEPVLRVGTDW